MIEYDLTSTELDEIQNHDDFIVVWASPNPIPPRLKNLSDYLQTYDSNESCIQYITQVKSDRKILLVSTDLKSVLRFEDFPQIQFIYVLQKEEKNIEITKNDHLKFIGIFKDQDELIDRLRKDIVLTYRNELPISISSLNEITTERYLTNLHGNTLMFLWDQLFNYYLIKFPKVNMDQLKANMLEQCRFEYRDNQRALEKIADFHATCSDRNALEWYTKDSFVYRLLNKAFRTRNIELIRKFQYFIILLYKQFQELSGRQEQEDPSIVYRGQILKPNSLHRLASNVNHLISINTFLSTSRDEQVARQFIFGATHAAIFKIHLPKFVRTRFKPFIDIGRLSSHPHEKEVLFFVGTVFRIDSFRQKNVSTWFIELTLNTDMSEHIERVTNEFHVGLHYLKCTPHLFMKTDDYNMINSYYHLMTKRTFSINNIPSVMLHIHLAFMLSNLGLYEKAIQFYQNAIRIGEMPIESPESKVLHIVIGHLYYHLSKYDDAFDYYAMVFSMLDETNLLTSELFNHLGDVWSRRKRMDIALSCYQEALIVANHQTVPSSVAIYQKIIDILRKGGHYNEALVYEAQVEEVDQIQMLTSTLSDVHIPPETDQSNMTSIERAGVLYGRGLRIMKTGDFKNALDHFLRAKAYFLEEPPSWDRFTRHLSTLFDNIALLYLFSSDYLEALTMWKKGIDLRSSFSPY